MLIPTLCLDVVLRVERGRMRNLWYPQKKAEFMTIAKFKELGLTQADVGERDHLLGTFAAPQSPSEATPQLVAAADDPPVVKLKHLTV